MGGGEEVKLGADASPRIAVNEKTHTAETQEQFKIQLAKGGAITSQGGDGSGGSRPNSSASRSR